MGSRKWGRLYRVEFLLSQRPLYELELAAQMLVMAGDAVATLLGQISDPAVITPTRFNAETDGLVTIRALEPGLPLPENMTGSAPGRTIQ